MPYANLMILYRKAKKNEREKDLNDTRRALIIRHAIDYMMADGKETPDLATYFTNFGAGYEVEAEQQNKNSYEEPKTAQEVMDSVFAAFEVEE